MNRFSNKNNKIDRKIAYYADEILDIWLTYHEDPNAKPTDGPAGVAAPTKGEDQP